MLEALDVARYLIQLSFRPDSPEESDLLCPLRLQKLLYYVQGWSLALRGRPIFGDDIEAWELGPVVPRVYQQFKPLGAQVIVPIQAGAPAGLSSSDLRLIEHVWREYSKYSASELIRKTHSERPWNEARGDLPPSAKSSAAIRKESLTSYFEEQYTKLSRGNPISPREAWEALEELDSSAGIAGEDFFAELLAECPER